MALILFLCALLSKTVTCSLPAALLLALWWRRGRLTRADVVPLLPFFALGVLLALATVRLERVHVGAAGADWNLSAIERCLIAGRALWFYAGTLIWPARLTFVYPRWEIDASVWWQYLYPVAAAAVFAVLVAFRRRIGTGPLIAVLFFAGTLVPALGFFDVFPMRYSYVADHFQYLASIGLLTLAASVGSLALARAGWERAAPFLAGALLCVLASLVWRQAAVYRDVETLWRDALAKNPGAWMAHNNLGLLLFQRGDDAAALHEYEAALRLKPDDAFAHNNIATVLAQRGDGAAAMEHLQAALRLEPANAEAHNNLGSLLASQGDLPLAAAHFETAVRLKPRYADAQSNLANVLALQGRTAEAIARYREALRLDPEYADAHRNLGTVLASAGDAAGAAVHLAEALRLRPADDVARQQLEALQTNVE